MLNNTFVKNKRLIIFIFLFVLFFAALFDNTKLEWTPNSSLFDLAAILSSSEKQELRAKMQEIWEQHTAGVYVVTTDEKNYLDTYDKVSIFIKTNHRFSNSMKLFLVVKREDPKSWFIRLMSTLDYVGGKVLA